MYSKPNCPWCDKGKTLLKENFIPHKIVEIGNQLTREQFKEIFPEQKTVPCFIINNGLGSAPIFIGSYEQFHKFVLEEFSGNS